jgi:hypothetical protein
MALNWPNGRVPGTCDLLDVGEWSFSVKRHSRTRMTEPKNRFAGRVIECWS